MFNDPYGILELASKKERKSVSLFLENIKFVCSLFFFTGKQFVDSYVVFEPFEYIYEKEWEYLFEKTTPK